MQQLEALCLHGSAQNAHARGIAAWPIEAGDETIPDWLACSGKNDRYCRARGFYDAICAPRRNQYGDWASN